MNSQDEMRFFLQDFHIHATAHRIASSDNMATTDREMKVEKIVKKSLELGFKRIGIIEHLEPITGRHPWKECLRVKEEVNKFKDIKGISVYSGCEVSIINLEGSLSASSEEVKKAGFDFLIASVHGMPKKVENIPEYHRVALTMMLNAIKSQPFITILGHPWRDTPKTLKRIGAIGQWDYSQIPSEDIVKIVDGTKKQNVALEITMDLVAKAEYLKFLKIVHQYGARFSLGSDAHSMESLKNSLVTIKALKKIGIESHSLWLPDKKRI